MSAFRPKLLDCLPGYGKAQFGKDLSAGITVGVLALPLAMAFSIASGMSPTAGIWTAIVAGFLIAAFGGSRVQIGGPTGAFIPIIYGIVAGYGVQNLLVATMLAGVLLLAMGLARLGQLIRFIPISVVIGFTNGIAVVIFMSQLKDFFGLQIAEVPADFFAKIKVLSAHAHTLHWPTFAFAAVSLLFLFSWNRAVVHRWPLLRLIPGPLAVLVGGTLAQALFAFPVETIGSRFGGNPQGLPAIALPALSLESLRYLIAPAITIALLGAIESLLSAVVADGMAGTRHDSNQELIGQGIANIAAPLFGGFASTGAIARTATNIRNGATSPLAGMVHALTLVAIVLALAPLAAYIPLCALAAILFVVAWNMSELPHFLRLARTAPRADVGILLVTFALTVFADLVIAVNVGVVLAALLFMRRMAHAVQVQEEHADDLLDHLPPAADGEAMALPPGTLVYGIDGPFFFGAAEKLERTMEHIQAHMDTVVLRMGRVPFVDATGIQALAEMADDSRRLGTRLVLCELRSNVRDKLARAGLLDKLGADNVRATLAECLAPERQA